MSVPSRRRTGGSGRDGNGRGVSELIGFVLVFSLVVAVVGIVSVAGVDTLMQARDAEQVDNAERAMEVLANNMADIHQRGAPSRATEISLEDAQMRLADPVTVTVENTGSPSFSETFTARPIVYDGLEDVRLVYTMGSVFRVEPEGGVVLEAWSPVTDTDYVSVPIVNTTASPEGAENIQSSTVLVRANSKRRTLVEANTTSDYDNLEFTIETPREELWKRLLDDHPGFESCSTGTGPERVECDLADDPETFYLVEHRIAIALKR